MSRTFPITEVIKIIDGDTIDVLIDLGFSITLQQRVRLEGVDTPEVRGGTDEDKFFANKAREWLADRLRSSANLSMVPSTQFKDPFGRTIAKVFADDSDISVELIQNHLAVAYDGETPKSQLQHEHAMNYKILGESI